MTSPPTLGRRALLTALAMAPVSAARNRRRTGGHLRLFLPWQLDRIDVHDLDDPVAAIFGPALCDTLYARSEIHPAYPALADGMPRALEDGTLTFRLREALRTSAGSPLTAPDVVWSLDRARRRGAIGLLEAYHPFSAHGDHEIRCQGGAPEQLARALSSPLTAIIAPTSTPGAPVGTGGFLTLLGKGELRLLRNPLAARGAAYLDGVTVVSAPDLATGLRAFEAGEADIGWLGAGLHGRRRGARPLSGPALGWVVLRTGKEAGAWAAPGVAQSLMAALSRDQLAPLGLRGGVATPDPSRRWNGPPTEVAVVAGSPYLLEVATTLAALLGQTGHELSARPIARPELIERRRTGRYGLLVDWVTALGPHPAETELSLLTAASPRLARKPPRGTPRRLETVTRALPLGVVGEASVTGAVAGHVRGLAGWSLPDAWRA